MIADPIEETFPFEGHAEFIGADGAARLRAPRAQSLREAYLARLAAPSRGDTRGLRARGWGFALHRTDRPAAQALLALRMRLEGPAIAGVGLAAAGSAWMLGLPLAFAAPAALAALVAACRACIFCCA